MAAELLTAERRAGYDLEELARQVRLLAETRGVEGGQLIPDGEGGARLPADRRLAVLALAALAEELSAEMQGERRPVEPGANVDAFADFLAAEVLGERPPAAPVASTVGELRRLLLALPADAPILAPRADGWQDEAAAVVSFARPVALAARGGWNVVGPETTKGRPVLLFVPRGAA